MELRSEDRSEKLSFSKINRGCDKLASSCDRRGSSTDMAWEMGPDSSDCLPNQQEARHLREVVGNCWSAREEKGRWATMLDCGHTFPLA